MPSPLPHSRKGEGTAPSAPCAYSTDFAVSQPPKRARCGLRLPRSRRRNSEAALEKLQILAPNALKTNGSEPIRLHRLQASPKVGPHEPGWRCDRNQLKSLDSRPQMELAPRQRSKALQRVDRSIARSASAIVSARPTWTHNPSSRTPNSRPLAAAA